MGRDLAGDKWFFLRTSPEPTTGCLLWWGAYSSNGKGVLSRGRKSWLAHRWAWTCARGEIPHNSTVFMTCMNPACVEPSHMFLGTTGRHPGRLLSEDELRDRLNGRRRAAYWKDPDKTKRKKLKRYNSDFNAQYRVKQLAAQGGVCAICGHHNPQNVRGWNIDHDHRRGPHVQRLAARLAFRGVLCFPCNMFLVGAVEKNPRLRKLIPVVDAYLTKWEGIIRGRLGLLDAA